MSPQKKLSVTVCIAFCTALAVVSKLSAVFKMGVFHTVRNTIFILERDPGLDVRYVYQVLFRLWRMLHPHLKNTRD